MLVYSEFESFVGMISGSILMRRITFAIYAALAGVFVWLFPSGFSLSHYSSSVWWVIGLILFIVVDGRALARLSNRRQLAAAKRAHFELKRDLLSPTRVREQLRAAEGEGVVWPTAIWPMLDDVIARSPMARRPWN